MKKEFFAGMVLLMLLLAGCKQQTKSEAVPFKGGTTGILMEFMEGAPPSEVFDGGNDKFTVMVKVKNDGEFDVASGKAKVSLSGINPAEFGVGPNDLVQTIPEPLEGTHKDSEGNIVPGTMTTVEFEDLVYKGTLKGNQVFPIRADICYPYGTFATADICIRKDLREVEKGRALCDVNEKKGVSSSGAPIQVTEFEEAVAGTTKIRFSFKVSHKGNGNIYKMNSNCDTQYANRNRVWVEVETNIEGMKCSGLSGGTDTAGYITLFGEKDEVGERVVSCTQEIDTETDYIQPVDITLKYDYYDDISTQILVKHG